MKSFAALALLGACSVAQAAYVGCFSSAVSSRNTTSVFMSVGACDNFCQNECGGFFALAGQVCHCGKLPAQDDLVEDAQCDSPCPGFPEDTCKALSSPSPPFFPHDAQCHVWLTQHFQAVVTVSSPSTRSSATRKALSS